MREGLQAGTRGHRINDIDSTPIRSRYAASRETQVGTSRRSCGRDCSARSYWVGVGSTVVKLLGEVVVNDESRV